MKCPYCGDAIFSRHIHSVPMTNLGPDENGREMRDYRLYVDACPACDRQIIQLFANFDDSVKKHIIWPKRIYRESCPTEVPKDIAADYNEACDVIDISPTAAAALARRCMQYILERDAGARKGEKLWKQVEAVVNDPNTPEYVKGNLHDLREIGNFSAHANEDVTGQVLRAEPEEAEWTLETLRTLFEHYYVGPANSKARKAALKDKLAKKAKK